MTTYTLRGYMMSENQSGSLTGIAAATLRVVTVNGNFQLKYVEVPGDSDNFTPVDLRSVSGIVAGVTLGGAPLADDTRLYAGTLRWGSGNETQLMTFNVPSPDGAGRSEFLLEIAGDALPSLTTIAAADSFEQSITGAFGSLADLPINTAFRLDDLNGFVSKTENDVLNLAILSNDDLNGQALDTGAGKDRVTGNATGNLISLGAGDDTGLGKGGNDTLYGGAGRDRLLGDAGADKLFGGFGVDTVIGGTGSDTLRGGGHNDRVEGRMGADRLYGDAGNDTLMGGTGNDTMTGGAGADRFHFLEGWGADRVTDFTNDVDTVMIDDAIGTVANALALARNITGGVVFDFDGGDVLTVMGVTKAQIADDIVLV